MPSCSQAWFTRCGDWLLERAKRTPYWHLSGYMERFWIVPYCYAGSEHDTGCGRVSWRQPLIRILQECGIAARVHHILRSDKGREPHDHPWSYLTIVLRGGYREERYDELGDLISSKWHGPGSILWRPANSWHRLLIPNGETAWTLFITGRKGQIWGFNVDGKKVPYREYFNRDQQ